MSLEEFHRILDENNIVVFIELFGRRNTPMAVHKNWAYDWDFRVFDVFDMEKRIFIEPNSIPKELRQLFVKYWKTQVREYDELVEVCKELTQHEGVVIKNYDAQLFTKWKPELINFPKDQLPNSEILGAINKVHTEIGAAILTPKKAMPKIARAVKEEARKHGKKKPSPDRIWRLYLMYIKRLQKGEKNENTNR